MAGITDYYDLYFAPRSGSIILDEWGDADFLSTLTPPEEKILIEREFDVPYILRIKHLGQEINSNLLLPNLTWKIYVNLAPEPVYNSINIILGEIKDMGDIIIFQADVTNIKITAKYTIAPPANANVAVRAQGWINPQI